MTTTIALRPEHPHVGKKCHNCDVVFQSGDEVKRKENIDLELFADSAFTSAYAPAPGMAVCVHETCPGG